MTDHIVKSYDAEFVELDQITLQMGAMGGKLLADAFTSLERRDATLAERVIVSDRAVDDLERQLQERAIFMVAKRQPMADDLRHVISVLKVASDLERIGDLAKNIAKRATAVSRASVLQPEFVGLKHMVELASRQLTDVLEAFKSRDADKALAVWQSDATLDAVYNSVFRDLLTYMMEDPRNISLCAHLLFGAKNIERIGDHTTNIAETVCYLVTGKAPDQERPKRDETNSTTFQVASG